MKNIRLFSNPSLLQALVCGVLLGSNAIGQTGSDATRKLELLKAYPDLVVVNGKIHTMDTRLSQVQAMAVRNNRILALGTNDEIRFLAGPTTQVLDAKGRVVLPALIDGHTHPNLWGVQHWLGARGPDIAKEYNMPELASVLVKGNDAVTLMRGTEQAVQRRVKELGPSKWIVIYQFGGNTLEESMRIVNPIIPRSGGTSPLDLQFLDTIAPNNPLIVFVGGSGTPAFIQNSKAIEAWKRTKGFLPGDGNSVRAGILWEVILHGREDVAVDIMKRELLECIAAHGIGTFGDRYDRATEATRIFRILYERGEMPVRYGYYTATGSNLVGKYENIEPYDEATITDFFARIFTKEVPDLRGIGNDYIWMAGIANEGWEDGISCTTAELPPSAAPKPEWGWEPRRSCSEPIDYNAQTGYRGVRATLENNLRIAYMHGYSDGTYDALFNMIEQAIADGKVTLEQVRAMRISTEHNPIIRPDQVAKFAKYNMMPGFNGYQVQGEIKGGAFLKTYGERYMNWMVPLKSLVNAGVKVVFNTDAHLTDSGPEWKSMEMPEQWREGIWSFMEFFATRDMPHDDITYNRAEAIDKVTLMKAATIWGAEGILNEKNIGSLEVGKLADFIVLDKDYFTIPENQIHTIKVLLTAVGGQTVFKAQNY